MRYAAFLRGVNVGGRKSLTMGVLRAVFEGMGFTNVRTIQTSGNVVFDAREAREILSLSSQLEQELLKTLGYPIRVTVRRLEDIQRLVASDPFHGVPVNPAIRLYVTFLSRPAENAPQIPPDARAQVVALTGAEVLTAITLSPGWGTTELMAWLEKHFGTDVTTRNWNTVLKTAGT